MKAVYRPAGNNDPAATEPIEAPAGRKRVSRHFALITVLVLLLSGCAGTKAPEGTATLREAKRLESSASQQRIQAAPGAVENDLRRALRLYSLIDEVPGCVRIHLNMASLYEQQGLLDAARSEARAALSLARALGNSTYLYRALITIGRMEKDPEAFRRALQHAQDRLQRAVVLTYLGRPEEAGPLVVGMGKPSQSEVGDLAFVLFSYARHSKDPATAERALQLYKLEDNYRGIAASLRLLAEIASDRGQPDQAAGYQARAQRVESALHSATKATATKPRSGSR